MSNPVSGQFNALSGLAGLQVLQAGAGGVNRPQLTATTSTTSPLYTTTISGIGAAPPTHFWIDSENLHIQCQNKKPVTININSLALLVAFFEALEMLVKVNPDIKMIEALNLVKFTKLVEER